MILNFPIEMPPPGTDSASAPPVRERLFRMGEAPRSGGERERWGWALLLAALVHGGIAGVTAVGLTLPSAPRQTAPEEPELVFMHFAPPPPPAASATSAVRPERVKSRPRTPTPRPVFPRVIPQETLPEKPVETPPEPEPAVSEPEPATEQAAAQELAMDSAGVGNTVAGVLGGVLDGQEGGLVGATGGPLELKQVASAPRVLQQVKPQYPRSARNDGIEGLVLVRVIIGVDGRIEPGSTRVVRSVPALDEAAVSAVSQWRFAPALGRQGRPVRVIVEIPVQFSLK
ncbi:energy transducer TonB [Cystobacter fuscus]